MPNTSKKNRVLVVEDERPLSSALISALQKNGFRVDSANNGLVGLAIVKKRVPDVIVLDLIMPEMDGVTMLRKLRLLPGCATLPVIVLSNVSPTSEVMKQLHDFAIEDFLMKSDLTLANVIARVNQVLAKQSHRDVK